MFSPKHEIFKFAWAADELDDWLSQAEELVNKWRNNKKVTFDNSWEIILASYLLMDDLLPLAAKKAIANILLETIIEAGKKKLTLNDLKVYQPPSGRKADPSKHRRRHLDVKHLISDGLSLTRAYKLVAEKHNISPDTIRRSYERMMKKLREN
jgi:DNA-binding NarL/FixJ family response regulator